MIIKHSTGKIDSVYDKEKKEWVKNAQPEEKEIEQPKEKEEEKEQEN